MYIYIYHTINVHYIYIHFTSLAVNLLVGRCESVFKDMSAPSVLIKISQYLVEVLILKLGVFSKS